MTTQSSKTRRQVLRGIAGLGAAAGLGAVAGPAAAAELSTTWRPSTTSTTRVTGTRTTTSRPRVQVGTPAPTASPAPAQGRSPEALLMSDDPILHVARRLTYGGTPEVLAEIRSLGIQGWIDRQLNPASIDDSVCDSYLRRLTLLPKSAVEIRASIPRDHYDAMEEVMRGTLMRAAWSKRQVFELMVEFWSNHFNTTCLTIGLWDVKSVEDREVTRKHALGRFADLLKASATSPAMLRYLNNAESMKGHPNENYARELLELHTVGLNGGYTETDIKNAANLLTGMTVSDANTYLFRPDWHHVGPVRIMDWSHPNADARNAQTAIVSYLDYLAHHPSTARHLARKLAVRFVSDNPPQELIDRLAQVYLANDTAIVPVLKTLFSSPEFFASAGMKERRPIEDLVGAVRVMGIHLRPGDTGYSDLQDLNFALIVMGQGVMNWQTPDGYPDVAEAWRSPGSLIARWNCHVRLALGWWNRDFVNPGITALLGNPSQSMPAGQLVDRLCERLLMQRMRPEHRKALLDFMGLSETAPAGMHATADHLGMLAKLVLDSPYWERR